MDIDRILRPELRDCNTICVANKQRNDTAYFSGVNVDQLLFFLKLLKYPPAIVGFVEENRGNLVPPPCTTYGLRLRGERG